MKQGAVPGRRDPGPRSSSGIGKPCRHRRWEALRVFPSTREDDLLDTSDIHNNAVFIGAYDSARSVIRRDRHTIVVHLTQDEVLTLIKDLASASWAGSAHLIVETGLLTYPRSVFD